MKRAMLTAVATAWTLTSAIGAEPGRQAADEAAIRQAVARPPIETLPQEPNEGTSCSTELAFHRSAFPNGHFISAGNCNPHVTRIVVTRAWTRSRRLDS